LLSAAIAAFVSRNCRLVRGSLLLFGLELLLLLPKRLLLGLDLLLVCLGLLLGRGYASLNVFCILEIGALNLTVSATSWFWAL
jgi:hypothetical protein